MRLTLLAALAAATALVPAAASAQHHDRGSWHGGGNRQAAAPARPAANRPPPEQARRQYTSRPQAMRQVDRAREARPATPDHSRPDHSRYVPNRNDGRNFNRPDAARERQSRPDGDWRARAGGSHFADRNDGRFQARGRVDRHYDGRGRPDGRWNNNRGPQRGAFDRNWRQDRRYDWNDYRTRNRRLYHLPRYYAPSGWGYGYRRFGVGYRLNSVLFGSNYWISDPYYYRLPPAYGPYRWVRYYDDALLVDIYTGTVVDVVHDIFW